MRHKVAGRKLSRDTGHRNLLRRNLITELFRHGAIKTTEAKAKAIRAEAEKMITLARNRGDAERIMALAEDGNEETLSRMLTKAQTARLIRAVESDDVDSLEKEAMAIAVHARRLIGRKITNKEVLYQLFTDIAPRYIDRPGGYTRMVKLGPRKGDAAKMVKLMLIEEDFE